TDHRLENRETDGGRKEAQFPVVRQAMEKDIMIKDFNVSEKGHGSYWLLGILRWVMVLIFVSFGIQKFTPQSADGIALYISNSPFVSWLSIFGIRGEAYLLGSHTSRRGTPSPRSVASARTPKLASC